MTSAQIASELFAKLSIEEEAAHQAKELVANFTRENREFEEDDSIKFPKGKQPGRFRSPKITSHRCDVADPDSVSSALSEIIQQHGRIDNLVTSAGFTENHDAIAYPYDRMKKLWGVNVDGTYLFATGVAKHLMERNEPGSIVMIGSMSGAIVNVPQPQAPYNASKAAVRHLAASLAVEWAHANIRVNCISPGYMLTPLYVITAPLFPRALFCLLLVKGSIEAQTDMISFSPLLSLQDSKGLGR